MAARLFEGIIAGLHDATLDPSRWPTVLNTISKAAGAVGAALIVRKGRTGIVEWATFCGPCSDSREDYLTYCARLDPFLQLLGANRAKWLRLTECIKPSALSMDKWYEEFALKCGIADTLAMQTDSGPYTVTLGLHDAANRVPLRASLVRILELLIVPVGRAAEIQLRLRDVALQALAGQMALNLLATGFLVVDVSGRVLEMNSLAEQALSLGDGLVVQNGQLKALWPVENIKLAEAISLVLTVSKHGDSGVRSEQVAVRLRGTDRIYSVTVTQLGVSLGYFSEPLGLVLFSDMQEHL